MKKVFALAPIALLSLAGLTGCGESEAAITLYDANSRFVANSFDEKGSIILATYRSSKTGEVPYVDIHEFFRLNRGIGSSGGTKMEAKDGIYTATDDKGMALFTADPSKDVITVSNYDSWSPLSTLNNGIGPDVASSADEDLAAVKPSPKTKIHGERKVETYDLKPYHFDIVEKDGKCYAPMQLLSNIFYRFLGFDILYNGLDFYYGAYLSNPMLIQSYYATKDRFYADGNKLAKAYPTLEGEAYRYAYKISEDPLTYRILSLTKDGKGLPYNAATPTEKGTLEAIPEGRFEYTWTKENDAILLTKILIAKDAQTGSEQTLPQGTMKLPLKDSWLGKDRPQEVARFGYDLLRFQFDKFYGLKSEAGFTDFESVFTSKKHKEGLLSTDPNVYNEALATFLGKTLNDPHTVYNLPSIFSEKLPADGNKLLKETAGDRYNGLLAKQQEYFKLRNEANKAAENADPANLQGLFVQNKTAVIRFDSFGTKGTFISNSGEEGGLDDIDIAQCFKIGDAPLGFDAAFNQISKNKAIENVVIDLTCNGGGNVMALPYILAHFTDDPTIWIEDRAMGFTKEFHYSVDLNHDKKWGATEDTYKGKYKFFILTSDFSFSCANFLPMFAKQQGAKVIGVKGGGGACTVGGFSDGSGSIYAVSSPQVAVYPNGSSFANTENGCPVDAELASDSWYDLAKLDAFVSNLK